MINGERFEMTGLKLTLIGVPLKMLYPWVSSSSLCADRARVSLIFVWLFFFFFFFFFEGNLFNYELTV